MPDDTTHLARLRERMLATAYCNADFWTQRTAFRTDQAVAALARYDAAAAEILAASVLAPYPIDDTQILDAAAEAGIDTSTWEARRDTIRAYARNTYELPSTPDPATEAGRIWTSLFGNYRPVAAALVRLLRDLPATWHEDLFTVPAPFVSRQAAELPGPETAPYDPLDWEDCPACIEAHDQCRYHRGVAEGMEYQRALITTALTDHTAIDHLQQRHGELEAATAKTPAEDASPPATV
ncbi:hypothetical protein J8N05_47160 (plasmid) [Streptomyces sp. BH-SS-21]|uniref:Uncharacterized protein n=1 Tax=Streptomyces liliiviolaceus TaxID=2823109 RepID=A0A940Y9X3_9ACTN|nr:hypothetical protein [Streptomyces liliiviolaceus]MBQ0855742.1 hypothetical protein [Streptomyces liliiviolaceus]